MKTLKTTLFLMMISSSILFAQSNLDIAPEIKINPNASTFTDDLFDHQFDFPCGDASGEAGIETNGDYIYTSKWNGDGFFCYEMDGTFLGAFPVPGESAVRDMAYDGTYFYGAAASTSLYEMDFVGQSGTLISTLTAAVATRACAYDAEYDGFWGNNWSDPITLYDRSGGILNQFNCGQYSSYYGFAWLIDAGSPWLYGFAQSGGASQAVIVQIDPETGAETGVTFDAIGYSTTGTGIAGGLAGFDAIIPMTWTLLGIIQNETIFGIEGAYYSTQIELDLSLKSILEPNTGYELGVEDIVIKVKNQGIITQSNFDVRYRVDGNAWITETIPGPLAQGETIEYTFSTPYDFLCFTEYYIEAEVILPDDWFPDNNFCDKTIRNFHLSQFCYYSITMWDDYGDGWNGGHVKIFGDGYEFIDATLESGSGPETVEFLAHDGFFLTAVWISGGWSYECSYIIYDGNGFPIFEDGMGGVDPTGGDIGYASCSVPPLYDVGVSEIISPVSGVGLGLEEVTILVKNYGSLPLYEVPVGFCFENGDWILEEIEGPIYSCEEVEYTFSTLADLTAYTTYFIEACSFFSCDIDPLNDCWEKEVTNWPAINTQTFNLVTGYQFVSSSIIPPDPDMVVVMADILNDNLDFVRNSKGQTLRKIGPNWVNGIGDWVIEEGYLVNMYFEDSFTIEGEILDPGTPISISTGYQFISYFPWVPMDALLAFQTIIGDDLDFIRNSTGQILRKIGSVWINGIGDCNPTEGYLVKMFAAGEIVYPVSAKSIKKTILVPSHFSFEGGNPADPVFTIYVDGLEIGDEIAAFDGDILVGAIKINSQNIFDNDLPIFNTINSGNGYTPGNPIILKAWNTTENKECILNDYTFSNHYGDAWTENVFPSEDGEYSLLHFSTTGISDENEMTQTISIHPNPSEGIFNISIEGVIGKIQIKVLDIHGNDYRFFEIEETRNLTTQQLDLKELGVGVYFISISGENFNQVKKIVIQ